MTTPEQIAAIVAGLTKAQRNFILALSSDWARPRDIRPHGTPSHTSNRNRLLVESDSEGEPRRYRLTETGLAVKKALQDQTDD